MTLHRSLALAGFILLAVPACATAPVAAGASPSASASAVDLGPSFRVPATQIAMAGAGHEAHRPGASAGPVQPVHEGGGDAHASGTVNAVDPAQHKVNLSHTAIPALGWPVMTMDFPVAPSIDLHRVKPGARVDFSLEKGKDGMYEVRSLQPAGAGR